MDQKGSPLSTRQTNTITIKQSTKTAETYTCTAVNVAGTSTSTTHTVTVYYKPEVTQKVSGKDWEGDILALQCVVDDASPSTILAWWWTHSGTILTVDNNKYVYLNNTRILQIKNLATSDNGVYKCYASNIVGVGTSSSYSLDVKYKPKVTVQSSLDITEGVSSVNIPCTWTANPNTGKTHKWTHKTDTNIDTQSHYTVGQDGSLTIANVKYPRDNGTFTCVVTNSIGNGQASVIVHVKYCSRAASDGFSIIGISNGMIQVLSTAAMTCKVDENFPGNPQYTGYIWYKGDTKINDTSSGTTYITPRALQDGGIIVNQRILSSKMDLPHIHQTRSRSQCLCNHMLRRLNVQQLIHNDSTFTITCYASGNPAVSISWIKDSRTLINGADYAITETTMVSYSGRYGQTTATKSTLTWRGNVRSDVTCGNVDKYSGRYQCQANSNGIGTDEKSQVKHISVQYRPIYDGAKYFVTGTSKAATLRCDVCANPFPNDNAFIWTFNGTRVYTGQTYRIQKINMNQYGKYVCSVSTKLGSLNA